MARPYKKYGARKNKEPALSEVEGMGQPPILVIPTRRPPLGFARSTFDKLSISACGSNPSTPLRTGYRTNASTSAKQGRLAKRRRRNRLDARGPEPCG